MGLVLLGFEQKAGGLRGVSYRSSQFSTLSAVKSSYEYLQATIPWTSHTEKFKTWKKSGVIKGNKHSPLSAVSCLSSHRSYLLPYLPPPNRGWVRGQLAQCLSGPEGGDLAQSRCSLRTRCWGGEGGRWGGVHFHLPGGHRAVPTLRRRTRMVADCHLVSPSPNQYTETSKTWRQLPPFSHLQSIPFPLFSFTEAALQTQGQQLFI